jgi:hypothetical protein
MLPSVATVAIVETDMGRIVLAGVPSSCAETKRGRRATEKRKWSMMFRARALFEVVANGGA